MFMCFKFALFIVLSVIHPCVTKREVANDESSIDLGGRKTPDLSYMFLSWKYRQMNQNDTHVQSDFDDGVEPGNASVCHGLLHAFSRNAGLFVECSINYSRPFKFCEGCVVHYQLALSSYSDIVKNDEKSDNCRLLLLNSDRVQIINSIYKDFTRMWNNADCNGCFAYVTMDANKTVHSKLTDKVLHYEATYANFTNCLPAEEVRRKHWNATVCDVCRPLYRDLNNQFDTMLYDLDAPHHVCMDIVDMMNYSRLMWGDELNCTVVDKDPIPAMTSVGCFLGFPIACLIILIVYQKKELKKLFLTKRLSSYTNSFSRSYGTYDNSQLLSGESDTATSSGLSNHDNNSTSPSDREPVETETRHTTTAEIVGRNNEDSITRRTPSTET